MQLTIRINTDNLSTDEHRWKLTSDEKQVIFFVGELHLVRFDSFPDLSSSSSLFRMSFTTV